MCLKSVLELRVFYRIPACKSNAFLGRIGRIRGSSGEADQFRWVGRVREGHRASLACVQVTPEELTFIKCGPSAIDAAKG